MPAPDKVSWPMPVRKDSPIPPPMMQFTRDLLGALIVSVRHPWAEYLKNDRLPVYLFRFSGGQAAYQILNVTDHPQYTTDRSEIPLPALAPGDREFYSKMRELAHQDDLSWYFPELAEKVRPFLIAALRRSPLGPEFIEAITPDA